MMTDSMDTLSAFRALVIAAHRDRWELLPLDGSGATSIPVDGDTIGAVLSGKLRAAAAFPADLPLVGDTVRAERAPGGGEARILEVEPRRGMLSRKRPGDMSHDAVAEQPLAANVDLALLAMGVDGDFSPRRLERYLTLAWDSGAKPLIVLTKADLCGTGDVPPIASRLAGTEAVALGARILVTSAKSGEGIDLLREVLVPGSVAILLGSSGVGKSTLLNALAGADLQAVSATRDYDGKGRHTTTSRRLVKLPRGAWLVDTPGMREIQLWGDESSLEGSFPEIEALAAECRFNDCSHEGETGCAIAAALDSGDLAAERYESWKRLRRELEYLRRKTDTAAARAERDRWKAISKLQKYLKRERGR